MASARAIVAEPDREFGRLVAQALELAGFQPSRCETGVQFRIELHSLLLPGVETVLFVVAERFLRAECAAVTAAAKTWMSLRGHSIFAIWTTDMGSADGLISIDGIEVLSILEKPFDLRQLERIAGGALARDRADAVLAQR